MPVGVKGLSHQFWQTASIYHSLWLSGRAHDYPAYVRLWFVRVCLPMNCHNNYNVTGWPDTLSPGHQMQQTKYLTGHD